jgi:hypothetical protein
LPAFTDAVVAFVEAVDQESPFYPKEIYEAQEKLVLIAQRERTDVLVDRERFHGIGTSRENKTSSSFVMELKPFRTSFGNASQSCRSIERDWNKSMECRTLKGRMLLGDRIDYLAR